MKRVRLVRPSYFLWVIVPAALYAGYATYGLPHVIWKYEWRDDGQGYAPFAPRYYTKCEFVGPYGVFVEHYPADGKCGWVQFHRSKGDV